MAIAGGQILHVGSGGVLIDRLQTAGPGDLNINKETIRELGNYKSIGVVRDVPDITFNMESLDTSNEIEAMLMGVPTSTKTIDCSFPKYLDIQSPWKAGRSAATPFAVVSSVALPGLFPESISYRFGLRDSANQQVSLRGDSIYYAPGAVRFTSVAGTGTAGQTITPADDAGVYVGTGGETRVLAVTTRALGRLSEGADYTVNDSGSTDAFAPVEVTLSKVVASTDTVTVITFTDAATEYLQTVHADTSVKPAAIRGRDIEIYAGFPTALTGGPTLPAQVTALEAYKQTGVQSMNVDWRLTVETIEEFGSEFAVGKDYDTPTVSGTFEFKPRDVDDYFKRLRLFTDVAEGQAVGPRVAAPKKFAVVLKDPNSGAILKVLQLLSVTVDVPGYSGQVGQSAASSLSFTLNFSDDEGNLQVLTI